MGAYHAGYESAKRGEPLSANPYGSGTWESAQWAAGWLYYSPHGWLMRYADASFIRHATAAELRESLREESGTILVVVGDVPTTCYVEL